MPPNHLGRWNRECFEVITERHGFSVEDHRIEEFDPVAIRTQFINYRFMQQAQHSGSLVNRISTIKSQRLLGRMKRLAGVPQLSSPLVPQKDLLSREKPRFHAKQACIYANGALRRGQEAWAAAWRSWISDGSESFSCARMAR